MTRRARLGAELSERLALELTRLDSIGTPAPCQDSAAAPLWTSQDGLDRLAAMILCQECAARKLCSETAHARRETWGVWGGEDFEPTERKRAGNG